MTTPSSEGSHNSVLRAVGSMVVLIAVEIVHGTLRTIFLAPQVGHFQARQISVFNRIVPDRTRRFCTSD